MYLINLVPSSDILTLKVRERTLDGKTLCIDRHVYSLRAMDDQLELLRPRMRDFDLIAGTALYVGLKRQLRQIELTWYNGSEPSILKPVCPNGGAPYRSFGSQLQLQLSQDEIWLRR